MQLIRQDGWGMRGGCSRWDGGAGFGLEDGDEVGGGDVGFVLGPLLRREKPLVRPFGENIDPARTYTATVVVHGNRVRQYLDNVLTHDVALDEAEVEPTGLTWLMVPARFCSTGPGPQMPNLSHGTAGVAASLGHRVLDAA